MEKVCEGHRNTALQSELSSIGGNTRTDFLILEYFIHGPPIASLGRQIENSYCRSREWEKFETRTRGTVIARARLVDDETGKLCHRCRNEAALCRKDRHLARILDRSFTSCRCEFSAGKIGR